MCGIPTFHQFPKGIQYMCGVLAQSVLVRAISAAARGRLYMAVTTMTREWYGTVEDGMGPHE